MKYMKKIILIWLLVYSVVSIAAPVATNRPSLNQLTTSHNSQTRGIYPHQVITQNTAGMTTINILSQSGKPLFSFTPNPNGSYTVKNLITQTIVSTNMQSTSTKGFLAQIPAHSNSHQQPTFVTNNLASKSGAITTPAVIDTTGSTSGNSSTSNANAATTTQTAGASSTCCTDVIGNGFVTHVCGPC